MALLDPFVDIDWLHSHLHEVVPADVRWSLTGPPGRDGYEAGHIPGAVFVDLDTVLAAPPSAAAGRHPLPEPRAFAEALGAVGIGDRDTVIAYDDAGGVIAARLVWMLRAIDHQAAVLDGGLGAWEGPLESGSSERKPAAFGVRAWPDELLASIDDAARAGAGDGSEVLIDARDQARFEGLGPDPVDPRSGHIPGARSLPARENVDQHGRLLDRAELARRIERAGVDDGRRVISYCGSGVVACHNLLVLEQLGRGRGRLFPGSWSQWSHDKSRVAQTGSR